MRHCRVKSCRAITDHRDRNGSICRTCQERLITERKAARTIAKRAMQLLLPLGVQAEIARREKYKERALNPRIPATRFVSRPIDLSKYVPGTPPSPFLLEQVYAEARRAIKGHSTDANLTHQQSYLRRVSVEFHRRLAELGVPVEGATP